MLILALLLAAADVKPAVYTVSLADPTAAKTVAYTAGDNANLRAEPATTAATVAKLPLGTLVNLGKQGPAATIAGRAGHWVKVTAGSAGEGWLFDGVLTSAHFAADLDEDGEEEIVTLAFDGTHKLLVRLLEPKLPPETRVTFLDLGSFDTVDGPTDEATVSLVDKSETGLPMIKVYVKGPEMCGSGTWTHYVSYRSKGAGTAGALKKALRLMSGADAPVFMDEEVIFHPDKRAATMTRTDGEALDEGGEEKDITVSKLELEDGVFVTKASSTKHVVDKPKK